MYNTLSECENYDLTASNTNTIIYHNMIKHKLYTRRTKRLSTHKTITWSYPAYRTDFLLLQPSFKKMAVNRFAIHMLSIFNCMSQHYIHTMYCYKTFHYKRYTKYQYILFITMLPYRITPKHVITLTVKSPNMENETVWSTEKVSRHKMTVWL